MLKVFVVPTQRRIKLPTIVEHNFSCRPVTVASLQEFKIHLKNGILKFLELVINREEIE